MRSYHKKTKRHSKRHSKKYSKRHSKRHSKKHSKRHSKKHSKRHSKKRNSRKLRRSPRQAIDLNMPDLRIHNIKHCLCSKNKEPSFLSNITQTIKHMINPPVQYIEF